MPIQPYRHEQKLTDDPPGSELTSSLISGSLTASFLFPLLSPFDAFGTFGTDPLLLLLAEFEELFGRLLFEFDLPLPPRLPPLARPRPPVLPPLDDFLPPDAAPDDIILLPLLYHRTSNRPSTLDLVNAGIGVPD